MDPNKYMPHKPTLGWAIVALIVVILAYHFTMGKGNR